uniref:Uncharacterized protein n=1 Tax=Palpitomonas bilix TaxID=652834 RepID=A0A7S3GF70_9EUKA|mmetsp:Transcript_46687/g.120382  ORF Transcript_46687/g.120382 Transcript_46687/m.120382 type:complete len:198 (+) Transcript_46687:702-1295(+)
MYETSASTTVLPNVLYFQTTKKLGDFSKQLEEKDQHILNLHMEKTELENNLLKSQQETREFVRSEERLRDKLSASENEIRELRRQLRVAKENGRRNSFLNKITPRTEAGMKALAKIKKEAKDADVTHPKPESLVLLDRATKDLETLEGFVSKERLGQFNSLKTFLKRAYFEVEAVEADLLDARTNEENLTALALKRI